jgi:hypothetical protein
MNEKINLIYLKVEIKALSQQFMQQLGATENGTYII